MAYTPRYLLYVYRYIYCIYVHTLFRAVTKKCTSTLVALLRENEMSKTEAQENFFHISSTFVISPFTFLLLRALLQLMLHVSSSTLTSLRIILLCSFMAFDDDAWNTAIWLSKKVCRCSRPVKLVVVRRLVYTVLFSHSSTEIDFSGIALGRYNVDFASYSSHNK